jgi:hypothetical protein
MTFFIYSEFNAAALAALALITGREFFASKEEGEAQETEESTSN